MKSELQGLIAQALTRLAGDALAGVTLPEEIQLERTKDPAHGDYASNIAMALAKLAKRKPRELAEQIIAALPQNSAITKVEIAGPGFINFFLKSAAQFEGVGRILAAGAAYGRLQQAQPQNILLEFVSANPTGPLHVGHGRGAAYGDSLANLLAAAGHKVTREYYINDAGRQVDVLTLSVWLRYLELCGETITAFPKRGYPADYIRVCATHIKDEAGARYRHAADAVFKDLPAELEASADANETELAKVKALQEARLDALIVRARKLLGADYAVIQQRALDDQLAAIRATLDAFGVQFQHWVSERAIVDSGKAAEADARLRAAGHVYVQDGAHWLRTTAFGDEKDRVLFKADGAATYFANDLAYHVDKLDRGFDVLLNVWGADHHGYIARVRAAIAALTGKPDALRVQLVQFVTLASGRMGKRSGNFVTFNELVQEAGRDATRFFYLLRSQDQQFEFDIELARSQSNDNPVFYVQYAHARICRVFEQLAEKGWTFDAATADTGLLGEAHEQALAKLLARYPETIAVAAAQYAPHMLVTYLRELADAFHSYYNAHTFLVEDAALRNARLALIAATKQVLVNALAIVGVSAPEKM